jgi:hypothetical protein
MPTYDPTGHARLSTEAAALTPAQLAAFADEAEAVFGIAGTTFSDQDAADLKLAVVRQVNLTVRLEAVGGGAVAQESKGDQSVTVARDPKTGRSFPIDAVAQQIVDRVLAAAAAADGALDLPPTSTSSRLEVTW